MSPLWAMRPRGRSREALRSFPAARAGAVRDVDIADRLFARTRPARRARRPHRVAVDAVAAGGAAARPDRLGRGPAFRYRSGRHRPLEHRGGQDHPRQSARPPFRSEEHTSELQSLMRISYAVFCLKKKKHTKNNNYK